MIQTYHGATFTLNGEAFPSGPLTLRSAPREPLPPLTFTTTVDCDAAALGFFGVTRIIPAQPSGVVTMAMPYGILGTICVEARVTGADPMRETAEGSALTMQAEMDPRLWRRAVSMAVEKTIQRTTRRLQTVARAIVVPALRDLGYSVLTKGTERKQRKAMRRLLRAAGVTVAI